MELQAAPEERHASYTPVFDTPEGIVNSAPVEISTERQVTVGKVLRWLAVASGVLGVISVAGWSMHSPGHGSSRDFPADSKRAVGLDVLTYATPGCTDYEAVCFCPQWSPTCVEFRFELGDILIFGHGPSNTLQLWFENGIMKEFAKGAVHAAIITRVDGIGLHQISVTEALKGTQNRVLQSTLDEVFNHRSYHDLWVRRVDRVRYPNFFANLPALQSFASQQIGEPFDHAMLFPGFRSSDPNWFPRNPDCAQRQRAMALYQQAGGPGKWMCSELVAWTVAYGGGLNTDGSGGVDPACPAPYWVVPHMQPSPGDLLEQPYYDASRFHVLCSSQGCGAGRIPR